MIRLAFVGVVFVPHGTAEWPARVVRVRRTLAIGDSIADWRFNPSNQGPLNGGVSNGGVSKRGGFPIWTFPSFFVLFGPFWDFPDFFGIFPICSGMVRGFSSRFVPFLFLGLLRAPMRNSPKRVRDTIWTFPEKSGKPPGLQTPRCSFSPSKRGKVLKSCVGAFQGLLGGVVLSIVGKKLSDNKLSFLVMTGLFTSCILPGAVILFLDTQCAGSWPAFWA